MLLLDHYFPSSLAKTRMPDLNHRRTFGENRLSFSLWTALLVLVTMLVFLDRIVLGKHFIDQLLLGVLLGVWTAFFMHLCLRDWIYKHVRSMKN